VFFRDGTGTGLVEEANRVHRDRDFIVRKFRKTFFVNPVLFTISSAMYKKNIFYNMMLDKSFMKYFCAKKTSNQKTTLVNNASSF
jgi:hypothetical protein